MTIRFLNAKEYSLEWTLSLLGIDVVPRHEVELHMSEVRMTDLECRKQVFSWKKPVVGFFLEHPSVLAIMLGLLLLLGVFWVANIFAGIHPADITKKNVVAVGLLVLMIIGIPLFILRSVTPFIAEVSIRRWSKEVYEGDDVDTKISMIRQLSDEYPTMLNVQIFVYSHPFVPDKWYSVGGIGDSGKQEEYFFLHTTE